MGCAPRVLSRVGEWVFCQLPGCGFPWTCPLLTLLNQLPWGEGASGPPLPPLLTVLEPEVSIPEVSSNTPWKAGRGLDLRQSCQDVFFLCRQWTPPRSSAAAVCPRDRDLSRVPLYHHHCPKKDKQAGVLCCHGKKHSYSRNF